MAIYKLTSQSSKTNKAFHKPLPVARVAMGIAAAQHTPAEAVYSSLIDSRAASPAAVLALQRACGNYAVQRFLQARQMVGPAEGVSKQAAMVTPQLQRADDDKTETLNGKVTMVFDGEELVVSNDGSEAVRFSATSGRPTRVKAEHATKCKGSTTESYVNNPRYVAVKDHGPIPEGTYYFYAGKVQEFSEAEQLELIDAAARGQKNIKVGTPKSTVHTGDWGRGRAHLLPSSVKEGPKPCTDTGKRSAFYLHGGILRGSAGCIDIGSNFDDLAAKLKGNKQKIELTVKYKEDISTALSKCELMLGEVLYDSVTPNPLTFIPCFTELTNNADPEAKKIYEGLRDRFLARLGGGKKDSKEAGSALKNILDMILGGD